MKATDFTLAPLERSVRELCTFQTCLSPCFRAIQESTRGQGKSCREVHLGPGTSCVALAGPELPWVCLTSLTTIRTRTEQLPLGSAACTAPWKTRDESGLGYPLSGGSNHYSSVDTETLWGPEQPHPKPSLSPVLTLPA